MRKLSNITCQGLGGCLAAAVVLLLILGMGLAGCGTGTMDEPSDPPVLSGVLVDSPVAGLGYATPSLSGFTDSDGGFEYREGEIVTFTAGAIVLGSAEGGPVLTPIDIGTGPWSSANMTAVNIARFLQLLDADGDPATGIAITAAMRPLLAWDAADGANDGTLFQDEASIFQNSGPFATFLDHTIGILDDAAVFSAHTPRTLALRTATGARRHLDATLTALAPHPFAPYVKEVAIGVTDLDASKAFYDTVMGLHHRDDRVSSDRSETVYEDNRPVSATSTPNRLVLMKYDDETVDCTNRPVKLVFAVANVDAVYAAIVANGGAGFSAPADQPGLGRIGMALDPDGYLIELIEYAVPGTYLTAIGIGVPDIATSDDFYTRIIGMRLKYYLHVPYFMNEAILQSRLSPSYDFSHGMDVVLMDYFTPRPYEDVPARITFTVADPAAVTQAIRDAGLPVVQAPSAGLPGIAKDPLGYETGLLPATQ